MAVKELAPGTEIGGAYVIEAPISTGGMGAVHRARRVSDGAPVAIKQPLLERDALRFRIEARLLSRLRHPRVVRVHRARARRARGLPRDGAGRGAEPGDGAWWSAEPLPVADAVEYVRQACEALAYVHGSTSCTATSSPRT